MKKYYFKSLILGIMCLTISVSQSQNILYDGDFSLTTEIIPFDTPTPPINTWAYWVNYYGNGSDAYPMVVDEVCNFQIINAGSNTWDVQLAQWGFPLIQGHSYRLSFDVKADAYRSFGVYLGEDGGNYTNLIGYDRYMYDATTEWQTIIIEFEAFSVFPLHKLSFELGADNTTTYFDNVVLTDLEAAEHSIGIIGTAVNGWYDDVNMETTDGINYLLFNYQLIEGELKFRQDDDWSVNWGGDTFPNGIGWQDGPNIYVLEGTYDVTFNRLSGEYNFMATTCPNPEIICPWDIYVDNFPSMCGAYVDYPEVVPQANCGGEGIVLEQTTGLPSGSFFPVGITTNTFELTNSTGNVTTCSFNVTVYDTELPVIADLNENYEPLWPANHKMVPIFIEYITLDNCNISATDIYISTNEPENSIGDGNQEPDWEIIDEHNVLLRAERSGTGNGREYYITIRVIDDSWNYTERQVTILVPHDNGKITNEFIQSNQRVNKFILYPNGVDDIINIKGLKTYSNPSYYIVDMFGTIKKSGTLFNNQIDARTLSKGIYILKLEIDGKYFFKKFVKN